MRRFKNKKLATTLVVFLLVFIMAGAFAAFQTILDVRGRVNMYAPTVDAIISDLVPFAAPLGQGTDPGNLSNVADPHSVHDDNAAVRGPWLYTIYSDARFNNRVFAPTIFTDAGLTAAQGLAALNTSQTVWGHLGTGARYGVNDAEQQSVAWWAWGHQYAGADTAIDNAPFMAPDATRVTAGTIVNPSAFETLYLNLTFDNFAQFYVLELELANVGVVALEIDEVEIERVDDPTAVLLDPAWVIEGSGIPHSFPVRPMLQDGEIHPLWALIASDLEDGLAGMFNMTVEIQPTWLPAGSRHALEGNTGAAVGYPIIWPVGHTLGNRASVGLRFCVALSNWETFIDAWDSPAWNDGWADDIVQHWDGGAWVDGWPVGTTADDAIEALLDFLLSNALSGTFRIAYTVVPFDAGVARAPAGVVGMP